MIYLIGGSGFIGTRAARCLKNGGRPFTIVDKRESLEFGDRTRVADVRSISSLLAVIPDGEVIVNLAAEHRDDVRPVQLYQEVNVDGAANVCAVARARNVKTIVFTSSVSVYGDAPVGTGEDGVIQPFNEYGRTKAEAERIYLSWQAEDPASRTLVIVRPTVVFGEGNRGNVHNLFKQLASRNFVMVGSGRNRKSIAYVENVAAFIVYICCAKAGVHVFNYVDKPDFSMNELVDLATTAMGRSVKRKWIRLPYVVGLIGGRVFDLLANVTGRTFPVSAIRVKKFCSNTIFTSAAEKTGFVPPVDLLHAIKATIAHDFT